MQLRKPSTYTEVIQCIFNVEQQIMCLRANTSIEYMHHLQQHLRHYRMLAATWQGPRD